MLEAAAAMMSVEAAHRPRTGLGKGPMEPFAIVNLLDLDDITAGRTEGLEGRFARAQLDSRDLGVSHWRYAPGTKSSMAHRHKEQEEAYVVVAGSGQALLDGKVYELRQWDVVRCAPPVVRAFAAGPDEVAAYLEVGAQFLRALT